MRTSAGQFLFMLRLCSHNTDVCAERLFFWSPFFAKFAGFRWSPLLAHTCGCHTARPVAPQLRDQRDFRARSILAGSQLAPSSGHTLIRPARPFRQLDPPAARAAPAARSSTQQHAPSMRSRRTRSGGSGSGPVLEDSTNTAQPPPSSERNQSAGSGRRSEQLEPAASSTAACPAAASSPCPSPPPPPPTVTPGSAERTEGRAAGGGHELSADPGAAALQRELSCLPAARCPLPIARATATRRRTTYRMQQTLIPPRAGIVSQRPANQLTRPLSVLFALSAMLSFPLRALLRRPAGVSLSPINGRRASAATSRLSAASFATSRMSTASFCSGLEFGGVEAAPDSEEELGVVLIGRTVLKTFGHGSFVGTVVAVDEVVDPPTYRCAPRLSCPEQPELMSLLSLPVRSSLLPPCPAPVCSGMPEISDADRRRERLHEQTRREGA